jgi:5'-nucleotidase
MRWPTAVAAWALALTLVATSACGGDDDDGSSAPEGDDRPEAPAERAEPAPVEVLVVNDDGFDAAGIDTLVEALRGEPAVELTVVAPATQQSGTGGQETAGELTSREATTASGFPATAVEGFPSDSVRVAFDELGLEPDVVISGINEGQNLGPLVDLSGTVGAARAALREGVPALAVSQGLGSPPDYPAAAELVLEWFAENREALAAGEAPADVVVNLNVPSCPSGELRGAVEVASGTSGDPLGASDCTATTEDHADDVSAFLDGYATYSEVPAEPAA